MTNVIASKALSSPLNKIPGPWWASVTGLPVQLAVVSKRQVHFHHELHRRYGPFVRIAPNEIIVADVSAFKEIHRIGTHFVKSDFYRVLNPTEPGKPPFNLFAQTDPVEHAKRRRLLARGFSQSFLRSNWEDVVQQKVADAVQHIKADAAKSGEVDILKWWMFMACDVVSSLMFGKAFDLLKLGYVSHALTCTWERVDFIQRTPWFDAVESANGTGAMAYHFPLVYKFLKLVPIPSLQHRLTRYKRLYGQGQAAVKNSRSTSREKNIFANVIAQADKDDDSLTDDEIIVEAGAFVLAGTDTTANTLTYLIWAVLLDRSLRDSLEIEVAGLDETLTDSMLEQLPILNAVIKEALRLYGAAPFALPRVTPREGAKFGDYFIPGGTTVSTQAWTLHRDPTIYEDPEQ